MNNHRHYFRTTCFRCEVRVAFEYDPEDHGHAMFLSAVMMDSYIGVFECPGCATDAMIEKMLHEDFYGDDLYYR